MIGYTISPLDSNESILEKLNKLEKYLKDNKMYNLYTTSFEVYDNTTDFIPDASIDNPALNTISEGDLAIYKYNGATIVGVIIAVGSGGITVSRSTEQVLADDTLIQAVNIISVTTNSFKIQITDTKNNVYESGVYTINDEDTNTKISSINVTNPTPTTVQIEIEDTDGDTYTSNTFNVGGGGGAETVYVGSNNNIRSSNANSVTGSNAVVLGNNASAPNSNYCVVIGTNANSGTDGISIGNSADNHNTSGISIGSSAYSDNSITIGSGAYSKSLSIAIGSGASCEAETQNDTDPIEAISIGSNSTVHKDYSIQLGAGINNTPNSIQYKSHQVVSEENGTLKLSNELQLNNHLITIISTTNNFAAASSNGIKVTVDQDDSTHEQVQNLNHPTTDSSILNDEMVLAIYNYTDMTDPDNPVSEFTLCYAMFTNYDSVNNVCDCMLLRMGPTQTM